MTTRIWEIRVYKARLGWCWEWRVVGPLNPSMVARGHHWALTERRARSRARRFVLRRERAEARAAYLASIPWERGR